MNHLHVARARRILGAGLALALVLTACVGSTASPPAPRAETAELPPLPALEPPTLSPLTGLPAVSDARARRPALGVKIDNAPAARPPSGLENADIIYEEPVEGGVTRFIAIYQSRNARPVGPIRSARLVDLDVLAEYGRPLLSFSGAAGYVLRAIPNSNVVSLEHGRHGSIYRRDRSRPAPHNLYSSTQELYQTARNRNATPAPQVFDFGPLPDPPASSSGEARWPSGQRARVPYASSAWHSVFQYDPLIGAYRRSQGSTVHRAASRLPITARNVLVLSVRQGFDNRFAAARGTPELQLTGSGRAVLLRDGVRIEGRWERPRLNARTTFTDSEGRPFAFAPGNTWVALAPPRVNPTFG